MKFKVEIELTEMVRTPRDLADAVRRALGALDPDEHIPPTAVVAGRVRDAGGKIIGRWEIT
jgi:hypothetical protein